MNGKLFGGPTYNAAEELVHSYTFDGGTLQSISLVPFSDVFPSSSLWNKQSYNSLYNMSIGIYTQSYTSNYGAIDVSIDLQGNLICVFNGVPAVASNTQITICVIACDTQGNYDIDYINLQGAKLRPCFVKDTEITLADRSCKKIQDITYNDKLLVWNFDDGKYDFAKPLWIKKVQQSSYYYLCQLEDGTSIKLVGDNGKCHRLFSVEDNMFVSATDMVGKTTYTENGIVKVNSCKIINEEIDFYNVITDYHMNLFANGVLTSCRYNNLYKIRNMKFIKDDNSKKEPRWKQYEKFRSHVVLGKYLEGLRLYEQNNIPVEETAIYCTNLEYLRKNIDDFNENREIINNIENTEVGWVDPEGNVYGFQLYMPGQDAHYIIANKICDTLDIDTNNIECAAYLDNNSWIRYSLDYIFHVKNVEITDAQLDVIKRFVGTPNKCIKNDIKIGPIDGISILIDDFILMDKYKFEYLIQKS